MPLALLSLPLAPQDLRALADGGYSIVDQAARTPGLLIVQAPDEEPRGESPEARGDAAVLEPVAAPGAHTPLASRLSPDEEEQTP